MAFLDRDFSDVPTIPEYFKGKSIFLTGGTGFVGRVLIDRLLHSCPDLERIYLLTRSKKGVLPEKRLEALFDNIVFHRLRNERPGLMESKIVIIHGSIVEKNLGMSELDREMVIDTTNIIIHSAASVRFDDTLKESVNTNLRGTIEMIELAKKVRYLECFMHISTAFCNMNKTKIVEEKIYPPLADRKHILDICDHLDPVTLDIFTPKLLGEMPNTYVFTKQLAEQVVNEQRGKLPLVICRPSVVVACSSDRNAGYIDNFNGPTGFLVGSAQGVIRTAYADNTTMIDYIPVDVVVQNVLAAVWARGTQRLQETDEIPIYNACSGLSNSIPLEEVVVRGKKMSSKVVFENTYRPLRLSVHKNKLIYTIKVILFHVLPAIAIDLLLRIFGINFSLLKIQRRISAANISLAYFMLYQWDFKNENFTKLRTKIKPEDRDHFFYYFEDCYSYKNFEVTYLGARKYLMKQKEETLTKWKQYMKWFTIVDKIIRIIFYVCLFWWFFNTNIIKSFFKTYLY